MVGDACRWNFNWCARFSFLLRVDGQVPRDLGIDKVSFRVILVVWSLSLVQVSVLQESVLSADGEELRALVLPTRTEMSSSYLFKLGSSQLVQSLEVDCIFLSDSGLYEAICFRHGFCVVHDGLFPLAVVSCSFFLLVRLLYFV